MAPSDQPAASPAPLLEQPSGTAGGIGRDSSMTADPEVGGSASHVLVEERNKACCSKPVMMCTGCCVLFLILFAILLPTVIVPPLAQQMVDASTLTVVSAHLSDPQADSVHMVQEVELNNAGPLDCVMKKTTVTVGAHMDDGSVVTFGILEMPEIAVKGNSPTRVVMNQRLKITNNEGMARATASLLLGKEGTWVMNGKVTVVAAMGLTLEVNLNKRIVMPGSKLDALKVTNDITMGETTKDSIELYAPNTYVSTSILEIGSLGALSFEIYSMEGIRVGLCEIGDFKVKRGFNFDPKVRTVLERKDDKSDKAISQFFTNFNNGIDQTVELRGPLNVPEWLKMNIKQYATIEGIRNKHLVRASLTYVGGLDGWDLDVTYPNGKQEKNKKVHGVYTSASNPFNVEVAQKNWVFDVFMMEPLGYVIESTLLGTHTCPPSHRFSRLPAMRGIHRGSNKVIVDSTFSMPAQATTSTLLAVEPQPQQSKASDRCQKLVGVDCCFASLTTAAACRQHSRGRRDIPISMNGTADLVVGSFTTSVKINDEGIPLMYEDGLLSPPQMGIFHPIKCSMFTYLDFKAGDKVRIVKEGDDYNLIATVLRRSSKDGEEPVKYCLATEVKNLGCNWEAAVLRKLNKEAMLELDETVPGLHQPSSPREQPEEPPKNLLHV